jgi:hypothetical protein
MVVAMDREGNKTTEKTKMARLIFLKQSTFVPGLTIIMPLYDQITFSQAILLYQSFLLLSFSSHWR